MRPGFTVNNKPNRRLGNAKSSSDGGDSSIALSVQIANLAYLFRSQTSRWISLPRSFGSTSLLDAIKRIIFRSAKEKVVRIYASGGVAGMENMVSNWYRSLCKVICKARSMDKFVPYIELTIPTGIFAASPKPTSIRAYDTNTLPKAIFGCYTFHVIPFLRRFGRARTVISSAGTFRACLLTNYTIVGGGGRE